MAGVSRGADNSYVGGQIRVFFSENNDLDYSNYNTGQTLIVYGEIVEYSTNTFDGYNYCSIIPKYILEK